MRTQQREAQAMQLEAQAMQLDSSIREVDDFAAAQALYRAQGWTDGLPIVPPTEKAVRAQLEWALMSPTQLIGIEPVRGQPITAEKLAINAVMAGCEPAHFPVVATIWSAMLREEFLLHGATASTGGCAILVIINGDIRGEIGASGTFSALGGTDPGTAPIGRAVRLGLMNILDVRPGAIDRATLGHPGKLGFCVTEDEEGTSWAPLAQQRGTPHGAAAVTVMAAGAPRQIMNEWTTAPEEILETYAAEMRANMRNYSIWSGNYAVIIAPQHRTHLERASWSKADVAAFIHERARIRRREWAQVGKQAVVRDRADTEYCALPDPDHLLVVAAGGPAGGFGAVIPPWLGPKSRAVTSAIGACIDCEPAPLQRTASGAAQP